MPAKMDDSRRSIDVEKAMVLRFKHGLSNAQIAKHLGCSKAGIHKALKRFDKVLLKPADLTLYEANKGKLLESVEARMLCEMANPDKIKSASLNNVAYALGQVSNINRLEKGLSTSNVAYVDMSASLDELRQQRLQLQESLEAL